LFLGGFVKTTHQKNHTQSPGVTLRSVVFNRASGLLVSVDKSPHLWGHIVSFAWVQSDLSLDLSGVAWIVKSIAKDEAVRGFKMADVFWSNVVEELSVVVEEFKSLEHLVHNVS
jgi:hypothetical protein